MTSRQHDPHVREAILALYSKGLPYSQIVKRINAAGFGPISKGTVYFQVKKYHDTNSLKNRPKSGRPRNARTPQLIKNTRAKISRTPKRNFRKLAFEAGVSEIIRASCLNATKRLEAVVEAEGGYFEKK